MSEKYSYEMAMQSPFFINGENPFKFNSKIPPCEFLEILNTKKFIEIGEFFVNTSFVAMLVSR